MEYKVHSPVLTELRFSEEDSTLPRVFSFPVSDISVLSLVSCSFVSCPVYRNTGSGAATVTRQTANGEVTVDTDNGTQLVRRTRKAVLEFSYTEHPLLSGLGQHENGISDYAGCSEYLYPHNMKIPIPFLISSDGWAVWIRADCAMRYEGIRSGFRFCLEAADSFSVLIFTSGNCMEILKSFVLMNGKPRLLPRWAYGYLQSKERYHSSEELISVVREFRQRGLPLDCIVLDWLSWKEGCWGDKQPDPARFPDIRALTDTLHSLNTRLMVSVWPNMSKGRDCDEFSSRRKFLPGTQIYDAFDPEARDLYWRQCRRWWMDGGTDALWCDSSEPIIDPDWCGNEKRPEEKRFRLLTDASALCMDPAGMNAYGSVHTGGISRQWQRDFPGKRPIILSRSGGPDSASAGVVLWSGDICARWDVLQAQVTEGIRSADSGLVYWTLDIGAFFVDRREPWFWKGDYPGGVEDPTYRELYVRWFQYGALLPVFRSHGSDTPREPWRFGTEDSLWYRCLKEMLFLRYRLLPYIYSTARQSRETGLPMVRSMMIAFGGGSPLSRCSDQYMFGDALLVRPVTLPLDAGGSVTEIRLPGGCLWYDLFTGQACPGGQTVSCDTPLDRFPLFVPAGSVLPLAEGLTCTDELIQPANRLEIFGGRDGAFELYTDAGDGNGYESGEYSLIPLKWKDREGMLLMEACRGICVPEFSLTVLLRFPDGRKKEKTVRYHPDGISVRMAE